MPPIDLSNSNVAFALFFASASLSSPSTAACLSSMDEAPGDGGDHPSEVVGQDGEGDHIRNLDFPWVVAAAAEAVVRVAFPRGACGAG